MKSGTFVRLGGKPYSFFDISALLGFEANHAGGKKETEVLIALCRFGTEDRILDLGCGVGWTGQTLAQKPKRIVIGLDRSSQMIAEAQRSARHNNLYVFGDAGNLPFPDGTFDGIICEGSMGFYRNKLRTLQECHRVLRSGGVIGTVEWHYLRRPRMEILKELNAALDSNLEPLSHMDWTKLFRRAGFRVRREVERKAPVASPASSLDAYIEAIHDAGRRIGMRWPDSEVRRAAVRVRRIYELYQSNKEVLAYKVSCWEK